MLQNAYLVAKIGADTAENERIFAKNWQLPYVARLPGLPIFSKLWANFRSFSAVSAPIFATKYALNFCNIFQNLPDYLAEFFENWQNFNFANVAKFAKFCQISKNSAW